mmetsp:Transcript_74210/g.176780  ORF Transcript_74210/g.176780 Transcript_74210/m.176780 type:complete len:1551 (+) Transcript_74210:93-4745(+)
MEMGDDVPMASAVEVPPSPPAMAEAHQTAPEQPGKTRRRRVVMQRRVNSAEYERYKEKMLSLGLDPNAPVPAGVLDISSELSAAGTTATGSGQPDILDEAALQAGEVPPPLSDGSMQMSPTSPGQRARVGDPLLEQADQAAARMKQNAKKVAMMPKRMRTKGEQIEAQKHERAFARWERQQQEWEDFRHKAAHLTGRPKEHLVVSKAEEHRERVELLDLLERATPHDIKSGGHSWYHSLREDGTRFIGVGNMFSGLFINVKLQKDKYVHEIIRKPIMKDLKESRLGPDGRRVGARTWRDDEYLLQRLIKYRHKMKEMAPGQLELNDHLPLQIASAISSKPNVDGLDGLDGEDLDGEPEPLEEGAEGLDALEADEQDILPELAQGPHLSVSPGALQFHVAVGHMCTREVRLRNVGTANVLYEWVMVQPKRAYGESVLPRDPVDRFTCCCAKGNIHPGDEHVTQFTFSSKCPGSFKSNWSLRTYPGLTDPIVEFPMHAVAYGADVLCERRDAFKEQVRMQQVLHQVEELVKDIIDTVTLDPPNIPDLERPFLQERLFEERNADLNLFWTPNAYRTFANLGERATALRVASVPKKFKSTAAAQAQRVTSAPVSTSAGSCASSSASATGAAAICRGRQPVPRKVDPVSVATEAIEAKVKSVPTAAGAEAELKQVAPEPSSDAGRTKMNMMVEIPRAVRSAQLEPLERSPLWSVAYQTIVDVVRALPSRMAKTRRLAHLEAIPFPPVPGDESAPDVIAEFEARQETRRAICAEKPAEEDQLRTAFVETFARERFAPAVARFEGISREVLLISKFLKSAPLTMADRLRAVQKRQGLEGIELSGCVVMYEMDVAFLAPMLRRQKEEKAAAALQLAQQHAAAAAAATAPTSGKGAAAAAAAAPPPVETPAVELDKPPVLELDDVLYEQAKQRLQGLVPILEMGPLAVIVTAHLGEPAPQAAASAGEEESASASGAAPSSADAETPARAGPTHADRMRSLPSLEPLLDAVRDAAESGAASVEFVPHEAWIDDALGFAEAVRTEGSENRVCLMENLAAFPEELGILRRELTGGDVGLDRLLWANREWWAKRVFSDTGLQPDVLVQDSFTACRSTFTLHTGFWPTVPQRIVGPFIESEVAGLIEALQLRLDTSRPDPKEAETEQAAKPAGADEKALPAPLMLLLGGGGYGAGRVGEEALLAKLELLMGLTHLSKHEKDGIVIALAGELAVYVLAHVVGIAFDPELVQGSSAVAALVKEAIFEVLKFRVPLLLPVDLNCRGLRPPTPPEDPEPQDAKKAPKPKDAAAAAAAAEAAAAAAEAKAREEAEAMKKMTSIQLSTALAEAALTDIFLGYTEEGECYLTIDAQRGCLGMRVGPASAEEQKAAEKMKETLQKEYEETWQKHREEKERLAEEAAAAAAAAAEAAAAEAAAAASAAAGTAEAEAEAEAVVDDEEPAEVPAAAALDDCVAGPDELCSGADDCVDRAAAALLRRPEATAASAPSSSFKASCNFCICCRSIGNLNISTSFSPSNSLATALAASISPSVGTGKRTNCVKVCTPVA